MRNSRRNYRFPCNKKNKKEVENMAYGVKEK